MEKKRINCSHLEMLNVKFMAAAYEIGERIHRNLLHGHDDKWIGVDYK